MQEQDVHRFAALQQRQWQEELARNGLSFAPQKEAEGVDGVTCPACGTTAPLEDGACSDCGLVLG